MKILVLHTGGTISCQTKLGRLTPTKSIIPYFKSLQTTFPSVKFIHKRLPPILSETLNGTSLTRIAAELKKALAAESVDGAIITHGSDTVAYTGAFLSYIFGAHSVPIVLVCADLPLSDESSSGHINLRAAVAFIESGNKNGVFAVYKDTEHSATVHRASRLLRHRAYEKPLTSTAEHYVKINLIQPQKPVLIKNPLFCEAEDDIIIELPRLKKNSNVQIMTVFPGMKCPLPPKGCKAVILSSYHSGTVDTSNPQLLKLAKNCKKRGILLFVDGITNGTDYETMSLYEELGLLRLPPYASPCAMYIKLWILTEKEDPELKKTIYLSCGGDIIPNA